MRLNVELGETDRALLDVLVEETGATKKKIVVSALMFLAWAISEGKRGNNVVAMPQANIPYSHTSTFWSELIRPTSTESRPKP
jgi:hypothetical protein